MNCEQCGGPALVTDMVCAWCGTQLASLVEPCRLGVSACSGAVRSSRAFSSQIPKAEFDARSQIDQDVYRVLIGPTCT